MSAFYGIVRTDRPVSPDELEAMGRSLSGWAKHGEGRWHDGPAGIGHGLLQFTPEDRLERQPLRNVALDLTLVFIGRLDDRETLCEALDVGPAEARGLPDSVLAMRAFERWETDCLKRLVGSYAIAVWDNARQRLFAARSAFGARPLFYHCRPGLFAFASRPRGLFALPEIGRAIDDEHLADYLVSIPGAPGACLWRGIHSVEPGEALVLDRTGLRLWRHWDLGSLPGRRYARPGEAAEALAETLDRVVASHLRTASGVSVMMSGGLDSTAIAATAAARLGSGEVLPAFTEVPTDGWDGSADDADRYSDEGPFARAMAMRHPNLAIHLIRSEGFYFDDVRSFFEASDYPFRNTSNRMWWEACLRGAGANGALTVLTGLGGNATISWDGADDLRGRLARGDVAGAVRAAERRVRAGYGRSTGRALVGAAIGLLPPGVRSHIARLRAGGPLWAEARWWQDYSPISAALAEETRLLERTRAKGWAAGHQTRLDARSARLMSLRQVDTAGAELAAGYQSLYGVELRSPAYDQRLAEFCLSLDDAEFVPDGVPRGLIRQAMRGRVPDMILDNRKRGLQGSGWLSRLHLNRETIEDALAEFEQSSLVQHALDVPRLRLMAQMLPPLGSETSVIKRAYRSTFESGLMTGRFLRWVESGT